MNKAMLAVAGLVLGACVTAQAGFRTETTVAPWPEAPGQYVVQVRVMEVAADGKTDVLSLPKLVVKPGEESRSDTTDDKEQRGVHFTALVKEVAGGIEATVTVVGKAKGTEYLNTTQSMTLRNY